MLCDRFGLRLITGIRLCLVLSILSAGLLPTLPAHGDLDERIAAASAEIAKNPKVAKLYVLRAELYRLHLDFDRATVDLDQAAVLAPDLADIAYVRGRIYVDLHWPLAALAAFQRHLAAAPDHVNGYIARAQVLVEIKRYHEAAADYATAIAKSKDPLPEHYIERARLLVLAGATPAEGRAAAVACLDEGIAKIGALVTLELAAVDLEVTGEQWDAAIKRIDLLMAQSPRKEGWLERKGMILEKAGRKREAREAYLAAQAAYEQLADRAKNTPIMKELKDRLAAAQQRLAATQPTPPAP